MPTQTPLPRGTTIGHYRVDEVLGRGGFGITYFCWDTELERPVAIKEYFPVDLAHRDEEHCTIVAEPDEEGDFHNGLEDFLDEARTLAAFNHPNIVRVMQYMRLHNSAYMVMDYVEGKPLRSIVERSGPLPVDDVFDMLEQLLESLTIIHAKRFLHRDIKPDNIVRKTDGNVVLLDFGAARQAIAEDEQDITVILTPGYAPPEQYHGDEPQGPFSDLYSLAATMIFCLSGERPAESTKRMLAERKGQPDPIHELLDQLPRTQRDDGLLDVLQWMIQSTPEQRPQSADVLLESLAAEDTGHTVTMKRQQSQQPLSLDANQTVTYQASPESRQPRPRVADSQDPDSGRTHKAAPEPGTSATVRAEPQTSATVRAQPLPTPFVKAVQQTLAEFIGPIAKILCKNLQINTINR